MAATGAKLLNHPIDNVLPTQQHFTSMPGALGDVLTTTSFIVSSGRRRCRGALVGDCVSAHVSVSLTRKSLFFATFRERNTKRFDARVLSENVALARLNQARVRILTLDKLLRTISTARIAHVHDKKRTPD